MSSEPAILNFDKASHRKMATDFVRKCRGLHRFDVVKVRDTHTNAQRAYLFGVVYVAVGNGLQEAWGQRFSKEEIHGYLKGKFAGRDVINHDTGEVIARITPSLRDMDIDQVRQYIDDIITWAHDSLHVDVPSPDEYGLTSTGETIA